MLVRQEIPEHILKCTPEPLPGATETQRDVALYLVELSDAGEDCRRKLASVRKLLQREKEGS